MNRAFQIGTVLTLVVHMGCGCCLHHAHGSRAANPPSLESPCAWDHGGHEGGREPCDHRSGDQGCDGERCVFTLPEPGNASQVAIGAGCLSLIRVPPIVPGLNGIDTVDTMPRRCGPPVPLHLLNQALLL